MYELHHLKGYTYYIDGPTNLGVYKLNATDCVLIDTGTKEEAEIIENVLIKNNLKLKYIVNTHCHIDHSGADYYLVNKTNCKVITSGIEKAFMLEKRLDVALLYGALPLEEFKNYYINADNRFKVYELDELPKGLEAFELPGHHNGMIGIKTNDDVYFVADSYCSYQIVDKQKVLLIYDIKGYLNSLKLVESFKGNYIVPAHSDVTTDPSDVINHNRNRIHEIRNLILAILEKEMSIEEIIAYITNHYSLRMTHNRYLILAPTIKSYLSDLSNDGLIINYFKDNILYFKKK